MTEGSGIVTADGAIDATNSAANSAVQSLAQTLHLPSWFGRLLFIVIAALVMLCLVRFINRAFKRTTDMMLAAGNTNITLLSFARYVIIVAVYFIGGVIMVSAIPGATDSLTAVLASGGIIAVVFSLAAQDTLSNVAGGVMILFFKPFVIGDFVRHVDSDISGTIEEITLRHTAIRTLQNKRVIIPNGTINSAIIENANYADNRACELFDVGITYESDMEKAIAILRDEVQRQPLHLDIRKPEDRGTQPEVKVEVFELADSAVILRAWLWAKDISAVTELKFALNRSVKNRFDAEGIEFAYPHITITK